MCLYCSELLLMSVAVEKKRQYEIFKLGGILEIKDFFFSPNAEICVKSSVFLLNIFSDQSPLYVTESVFLLNSSTEKLR